MSEYNSELYEKALNVMNSELYDKVWPVVNLYFFVKWRGKKVRRDHDGSMSFALRSGGSVKITSSTRVDLEHWLYKHSSILEGVIKKMGSSKKFEEVMDNEEFEAAMDSILISICNSKREH